MAVFDFPYHTIEEEYPVSSTTMKFGGGYQFASKPKGPDQIKFILNFEAMWFSTPPHPKLNMQTLVDFYEDHRLYEPFDYPHPRLGTVSVRFATPLKIPEGIKKGRGQVKPFKIELLLQP
ncbi:hypothetical protein [Mesorhizobium sp. WSM2239]|uniref:Uncharacterized protein n=2 Tax=unclassified Mesorhizobium TaxID=325217 RepID=A0AAU8DEP2_9HYPH